MQVTRKFERGVGEGEFSLPSPDELCSSLSHKPRFCGGSESTEIHRGHSSFGKCIGPFIILDIAVGGVPYYTYGPTEKPEHLAYLEGSSCVFVV